MKGRVVFSALGLVSLHCHANPSFAKAPAGFHSANQSTAGMLHFWLPVTTASMILTRNLTMAESEGSV